MARGIAILLAVLALIAGALYAFRLPLAGMLVRSAMAEAGVERPEAKVTAFGPGRAVIEEVSGGGDGFHFRKIEAKYRLIRLWRNRKVDALTLDNGSLKISVADDGAISIAGVNRKDETAQQDAALPFDRLTVSNVALVVHSPDGDGKGVVAAQYDIEHGGDVTTELSVECVALNKVEICDAHGGARLVLSADGMAQLVATFSANLASEKFSAQTARIEIEGEGSSWKDAANGARDSLRGNARIHLNAPKIRLSEGAFSNAIPVEALFGEKIEEGALISVLDIAYEAGETTVMLAEDDRATRLTTPSGSLFALKPQGQAPLYKTARDAVASSFGFELKSKGVNISGSADLAKDGDVWRLAAPIDIEAFTSDALSLDASRIDVDAKKTGDTVEGDIIVKSSLKKAGIGRLTINDAPFAGAFQLDVDLAAKRASILSKSACFAVEKGRGVIAEQDLEIRLAKVTLCNGGGPLGEMTWAGAPEFTVKGGLAAKEALFRLGQTRAEGPPPAIDFVAHYRPAEDRTEIDGKGTGGAMTLNHAIEMSGIGGTFVFVLDAETIHASAEVARLRLAQHLAEGQTLLMAPVMAAGRATLEGADTRFSYTMTTPDNYRLGAGQGVHNMRTATGETAFSFGNLVFSANGLQPNRIFPALKGVVDAADGEMGATLRFAWAPGRLDSGANFDFRDISFNGPTRAVTRTTGFSGKTALTNLLPVTTDGVQTVTVEAMDMDALQLESGEISFEFPGDQTFRIPKAEFPRFGGVLGIYDATAKLTGEATIPLKASGLSLKEIFDYVKVDGLSGEGALGGSLPIVFDGGRASIEGGLLKSEGPGALRYVGSAGNQAAAAAGEQAEIAFQLLRDLEYKSMQVTVNGPLDGRLDFQVDIAGTGEVTVRKQPLVKEGSGRVPVRYRINLDAALLELLRQANLSTSIGLQIERGMAESGGDSSPE